LTNIAHNIPIRCAKESYHLDLVGVVERVSAHIQTYAKTVVQHVLEDAKKIWGDKDYDFLNYI